MIRTCALATLLAAGAVCLPLTGGSQPHDQLTSTKRSADQPKKTQEAPTPSSNGERVFQQNCARCHSAPEGFSPRISGTVVHHMRVRASLSQKDERELLRFLNP